MQLKIMITVIHLMNSDAGCGVAMVLLTIKLEQLLSKKMGGLAKCTTKALTVVDAKI